MNTKAIADSMMSGHISAPPSPPSDFGLLEQRLYESLCHSRMKKHGCLFGNEADMASRRAREIIAAKRAQHDLCERRKRSYELGVIQSSGKLARLAEARDAWHIVSDGIPPKKKNQPDPVLNWCRGRPLEARKQAMDIINRGARMKSERIFVRTCAGLDRTVAHAASRAGIL